MCEFDGLSSRDVSFILFSSFVGNLGSVPHPPLPVVSRLVTCYCRDNTHRRDYLLILIASGQLYTFVSACMTFSSSIVLTDMLFLLISDEEVDVVSLYDIDLYEKCKKPPTLITPPQSVLTSRSTTPNYHSHPSSLSKLSHQSSRSAAKRLIKSTLPTNPYDNLDTYEELQRNVAKVIKKSTNSKSNKRGRKPAKKKSKKNANAGSQYLNNQKNSKASHRATTTLSSTKRNYEEYKKQCLAEMKTDAKKKKKAYRIDLLPEKRKFHNNMERKRRVDLRNLFEELRELIPNLQNKKRAPKVQILNEAETLCNELSYKSKMQSKQAEELRREQARLRQAVAPLRHLFYEKNVVSYMSH